jgi:hypothetical protein
MKTIKLNIYKFAELPGDGKKKAIENLSDINVDFDWWNYMYSDAKAIGLIITSFDIDRRQITGQMDNTMLKSIDLIKADHGESCNTHKIASDFLQQYNTMFAKFEDTDCIGYVLEVMECEFDNELDELEKSYLNELLEEYLVLLRKEYEYQTSEQSVTETIKANDYDFTENGELY